MFTGIVKCIGTIFESIPNQDGKTLTIHIPNISNQNIGDSISVAGCCLTITSIDGDLYTFYISAQTLKQTNLTLVHKGQKVNIEQAMLASTPLGGHLVSGHIDEVAQVVQIQSYKNTHTLFVELSPHGKNSVIKKGSIAIDGVSLTIMNIKGKCVELNIIPHTWENTTLSTLNTTANNLINVELDQMMKIISKKIEAHFSQQ